MTRSSESKNNSLNFTKNFCASDIENRQDNTSENRTGHYTLFEDARWGWCGLRLRTRKAGDRDNVTTGNQFFLGTGAGASWDSMG